MSKNQLHGKVFEDLIKPVFQGSADEGRLSTSIFDIEKKFDKERNISSSIKSKKILKSGNEVLELSDARRNWQINEPYRLILCLYDQNGSQKKLQKIIEYIIEEKSLSEMRGSVTYQEVSDFHEELKKFKVGEHLSARRFAREIKKRLKNNSIIQLNPKIDSKTQRRLQCSIKRKDLERILDDSQITVYEDIYKDKLCLPISIVSDKRELAKSK